MRTRRSVLFGSAWAVVACAAAISTPAEQPPHFDGEPYRVWNYDANRGVWVKTELFVRPGFEAVHGAERARVEAIMKARASQIISEDT